MVNYNMSCQVHWAGLKKWAILYSFWTARDINKKKGMPVPVKSDPHDCQSAPRGTFTRLCFQRSWQQRKTRTKGFTLRLPVCADNPLVMYNWLALRCRYYESTSTRNLKPGISGFRGTIRRLYAVVSIEDSPNIPYVMESLEPEAYMKRPMTLWAVSPANWIRLIKLYPAYRNLLLLSTSSSLQSGTTMKIFFLLRRKCKWIPLTTIEILKVCHTNSCTYSHWQPF